MCIFGELYKSPQRRGLRLQKPICLRRLGAPPQTLAVFLPPSITAFLSLSLALNTFLYSQKEQIAPIHVQLLFFRTFVPSFHFKLCSFCWLEAQEYFLPQGTG